MSSIKKTIESGIASGSITKADIAKARGKLQEHSTTQYPSFIRKIEDVEGCLYNMGYIIQISTQSEPRKPD